MCADEKTRARLLRIRALGTDVTNALLIERVEHVPEDGKHDAGDKSGNACPPNVELRAPFPVILRHREQMEHSAPGQVKQQNAEEHRRAYNQGTRTTPRTWSHRVHQPHLEDVGAEADPRCESTKMPGEGNRRVCMGAGSNHDRLQRRQSWQLATQSRSRHM